MEICNVDASKAEVGSCLPCLTLWQDTVHFLRQQVAINIRVTKLMYVELQYLECGVNEQRGTQTLLLQYLECGVNEQRDRLTDTATAVFRVWCEWTERQAHRHCYCSTCTPFHRPCFPFEVNVRIICLFCIMLWKMENRKLDFYINIQQKYNAG
jgi:hypothetical protein